MSREEAVEEMRHLSERWEIKAHSLRSKAAFSDDVARAETLSKCSQELLLVAASILK